MHSDERARLEDARRFICTAPGGGRCRAEKKGAGQPSANDPMERNRFPSTLPPPAAQKELSMPIMLSQIKALNFARHVAASMTVNLSAHQRSHQQLG